MHLHDIYVKYIELLGIPKRVAHEAYIELGRLSKQGPLRYLVSREKVLEKVYEDRSRTIVILHKFRGKELTNHFKELIRSHGAVGLKAIIFYMILDILENILRPEEQNPWENWFKWLTGQHRWYYMQFCDTQHHIDNILEEVISFIRKHEREILEDLRAYVIEKYKGYPTSIIYEIYTVRC